MGTELEIRKAAPLAEKVEWVKLMATASLLPVQYRDNPGNLFYAVEFADSLGVDRINAITSIHVIQGKPTASADLIAGLVRKAGHKLRITGDDTKAVAQLIRSDDPDFTFEAVWDVEKATAAKLWGTDTWKKYPAAMLRARAITEVVRMGASDSLYGVIYTPEELGATVDAEGEPVQKSERVKRSKKAPDFDMTKPDADAAEVTGRESGAPDPAPTPASAPSQSADGSGGDDSETPSPGTPDPSPDEDGAFPAEVVEDEVEAEPRLTAGQRSGTQAHFMRLGVVDRTERIYTVGVLIGRKVESVNDLSRSEAAGLLVVLEKLRDPDSLQAAVIAADEAAGE